MKMHPSSVFKYFINNRKRFAIVTLAVLLGVFLLYSLSTVINSMETVFYRSSEPMKYWSVLYARGSNLSSETIDGLKQEKSVEKVIPMVFYSIPFNTSVGGSNSTYLYIISYDDMDYLADLMGLKLAAGRMPVPGPHEVVLHKDIARNMGVGIGDTVGSGLNGSVWLPDQYRVVGLLEGESLISFGSLLADRATAQRYGAIVVPKAGSLEAANRYLEDLESTTAGIMTAGTIAESASGNIQSVNLLVTGISIMVVIIVSACVGFLCYIYYMQRQNEYGLLWALGYTRRQVMNRAFSEIGIMNLAGFIGGIVVSLIAGLVMKVVFYQSFGQVSYVFNLDALVKSICVPIFSTFFSLVPIWRLMKKFDPIHVMDS